ncbi:fructose-specific PTS transporter subunit EIIC [Lactococcus allomyrinae]|uniref:PTS fructose transporter subunit IIABC n=1 Tax=Lactococcus allomyrinae TaxID=2419773 RepID=A0A387BE81_9LACT|nr:fructose-specific PTS transporter subunit EIIC [Lactococcus allomyrinae]AYG00574.1 PTS fructose transporter subunit IIABC [Lactococcus allomyrinae]
MDLSHATSEQLIFLNQPFTTKEEIFEFVAQKFAEVGVVASAADYKQALYDRENEGLTGFENGLAIPHGKSSTVKKATFAVVRLSQALASAEYVSLNPENQVDTLFILAIPEREAGSTHLTLLAELSAKIGDLSYVNQIKQAASAQEILTLLKSAEKTEVVAGHKGLILGITACAAGIAHTYMAAEAIAKKAAELGYTAKIEKQGANGIEDRITAADVNQAMGVIFAHDVALQELERFTKLPKVDVPVSEPIKNADKVVNDLLEKAKNYQPADENAVSADEPEQKQGFLKTLSTSVMTGISYMIPLLVAAGLMMGIATLVWAYVLHLPMTAVGSSAYFPGGAAAASGLTLYTNYLYAFGSLLLKFIYPIFGMFVAYSIAGRTGLVAGFAGGLFSSGLQFTIWGAGFGIPLTTAAGGSAKATDTAITALGTFNKGAIPSGFLGALILGLVAGFCVKWLNEHIKVSKNLQAIKPMFLIPGISVFIIFVLNFALVQPVFGGLNAAIANWITSMSGSGKLLLSSIIAACTAFDLGGPVNKAAGAINIALAADKTFPLTARVLAIVIPPIGLGLSTIIDRFVVRRRVYPEDLRVAGGTSFILGFIAISEGGIPFMLRNPLIVVPINIIGAIAGSCTAVALGAVQWLPLPAVWGWPLVTNIPAYLLGLVVGVLVVALLNIFVRFALIKRREARGEEIGF